MLNYKKVMKKKIFYALMAVVASLSLASCGDDDEKNDDPTPKITEATYSDDGTKIVATIDICDDIDGVKSPSEGVGEDIYYYSNGIITKHVQIGYFNSEELAQKNYKELCEDRDGENKDGIKDVTIEGKVVTVTFDDITEADQLPVRYAEYTARMEVAICNDNQAEAEKYSMLLMEEFFGGEIGGLGDFGELGELAD